MKSATDVLKGNGALRKDLVDALVDAFLDGLNQVFDNHFGVNLDKYVERGSLQERARGAVARVESWDRIERLIVGARLLNPGNKRLMRIAAKVSAEMSGIVRPGGAHGQPIDEHACARLADAVAPLCAETGIPYALLLLLPSDMLDALARAEDKRGPWPQAIAAACARAAGGLEFLAEAIDEIARYEEAQRIVESRSAGTAPFQTGGTLPIDAPTYVHRTCDDDLLATIRAGTSPLINVHGESGIGKSSMVLRAITGLDMGDGRSWATCTLDVSGVGGTSATSALFAAFGSARSGLKSWNDLRATLSRRPLVLVIDELAVLKSVPDAKLFAVGMHKCGTEHRRDVRIVAITIESAPAYFHELERDRGFDERLQRSWWCIEIPPLDAAGVDKLLKHLPVELHELVSDNRATIDDKARGVPRRLQCLCARLVMAHRGGAKRDALVVLIQTDQSYE